MEVDIVLIAIGRIANTENTGLENIEYPKDKHSIIHMDEFGSLQEIKSENIFAAEDITAF